MLGSGRRQIKITRKSYVQAEILKQFQAQNPQPQMPQGPEGAPAGAQAQDTQGSGGGQVGTGSAPTPGEPGFSANTGEGQG